MADEINFDLFHFSGSEVNHVQFAIPWKALSFHNFVGRIIKECDPENRKLNLHFLPILYINLEGDHVQLNWEEDEYLKFLDFIRRSKEYGHEYIHLIIPNIGNEKSISNRTDELRSIRLGGKELNVWELNELFSMKIDDEKSFRVDKALRSVAAHIVLPQPQSTPTAVHEEKSSKCHQISSSYGMLGVKRISGDDLPRLLVNGSQILVPTEDGNYLSMSFSKNYTYTPYKFFSWQNVEEGTYHHCQEMKIPVCVESNGMIRVSDESKNLIANVVKCGLNVAQEIRESEQGRRQDTCTQSQRTSQPGMYEQQTSFQHNPKFPNSVENMLKETCHNHHEEQIPTWFHRHMEKFKTELVADLKHDLMEQLLLVHYGLPNSGQDLLKSQKNTQGSSYEDEAAPQRNANKTKDEWEVVKGFSNQEIHLNSSLAPECSNQLEETDSNAVRNSEREYKSEYGTSNSALDELYDSDSSISITLDACVNDDDDVSFDSRSSFIRIPRCFVTQFKDASESTSASVPVRVKKHRAAKKMKSTMSTTEFKMKPETVVPSFMPTSSSQEGIISKSIKSGEWTMPTEGTQVPSSSSSSRTKDNGEMNSEKMFDSANTKNIESGQTQQPLNILPDKVFEMTNNVFKNVLNSVKIPHSNEVKESVQKVFEESMSAASRLIPNPLLTGTVPRATQASNVPTSNPPAGEDASSPMSPSDVNENFSRPCTVNRYVSEFDLSDKMKAELTLLNEMGFVNDGHNLFLLAKYPNDMEKVVESLVNFTVF